MIANKQLALLMLAVGALTWPLVGSTKNPITRPLQIHGTAVWVLDPLTGSGSTYQLGECTHTGRWTGEGTGQWDFSTSPPTLIWAEMVGTLVSGDQPVWVVPGAVYQCEVANPSSVTHGSSPLIACGFNTVWMSEPEIIESPIPGAVAFQVDFIGEGTVTY